MQITLKLYATLSDYLPEGAEDHSISVELPADATAYNVLDQFNVPREKAHLVLLNGVYILPEERDNSILREGDTLAIWPPVAGG